MNLRARTYVHIYIVAILTFYVSHLSHLSLFHKARGTHGTDGTLVFGFNLLPCAGARRNQCVICLKGNPDAEGDGEVDGMGSAVTVKAVIGLEEILEAWLGIDANDRCQAIFQTSTYA